MIDLEALKKNIEDSGIPIAHLAKKCAISRETFYNRLSGKSEFKASEMYALPIALRLTKEERDAIFFDSGGELNSHGNEDAH